MPPPPPPLQNPLPAKSAFKAFPLPSTNSLFKIGMQRDDKIFFLLLLLFSSCSLFSPPSPNNHPSKTTGKARRVYFFDRADRGGGGATDEKRIPRRRWKEGNAVGFSRSSRQPLRRPFYIHSSPPVVVFASRFMDKNRSSKPARNRKLHVYIYI